MGSEPRDVALTVPAEPGYLVLARLALSAVCRLTSLDPAVVQDLKLAVSEAAADFVGETGDPDRTVDFTFRIDEGELTMVLEGKLADTPPAEQALGRAIIEATVDRAEFGPGRTVLSKAITEKG
jgi:anti-sigma regulatory factor (Ser/Thr protein kinase)